MPNISLIVEYLLGGTQLLTFFMVYTAMSSNLDLTLEPNLLLLIIISFAYPAGIVADNIFSEFIKITLKLFKKEQKEIKIHNITFLKILSKDSAALIKRAHGFESTKRMVRITIFNCLCAFILLLLSNKSNPNNVAGLLIIIIIPLIFAIPTYLIIEKNYREYLEKLN